jgi:hypothetical protein
MLNRWSSFCTQQKYVDTENIREYEQVPGRAFMIVIPWHDGESLNIPNIYVPNRPEERDKVWKELWKKWADDPQLPFPNIALGDWNFVEDLLDRSSGVTEAVPESFKRLKDFFHLIGGWRATFPGTRGLYMHADSHRQGIQRSTDNTLTS